MRDREGSHSRIYSVVRRIPSGRVLTYGDVAALADLPRHARLVGYALHALPEHTTVPWHRVINHKGALSTGRAWPGGELHQRHLLEAEGVEFDANGRTSLQRYRWVPDADPADTPEQLYALIRSIPPGRVSTYSALARALGAGLSPREVGRAIAQLPPEHDIPVHRVVSARGEPLCPRGRGSPEEQREKLRREGIALGARGRVPVAEFLWVPEST